VHWLNNLSIQIKASLAAVLLLLCLLTVGMNAYLTSVKSEAALRTLSENLLSKQQAFTEIGAAVVVTHIKIFRHLSWSSNGLNRSLLNELHSQIKLDLTALNAQFEPLTKRIDFSEVDRDNLIILSTKWNALRIQAVDTIDIGQIDPAMETMMMGQTDDMFNDVINQIQKLSNSVQSEADILRSQMLNAAENTKSLILIVTTVGFIVSVLVVGMIGRSIVTPIRSVTDIMRRLSAGDINVAIEHTNRRDEIGQMAAAIEVFRKNIIDKQAIEQNLTDAIESISEGFALFDSNDELVVANQRYREIMLGDGDGNLEAGTSFRAIVAQAAGSERFPNSIANTEVWIERQIDRHRTTGSPHIQEFSGDQWLQISNRRTEQDGTVAVHSDITDVKRISDELQRAKDAAESANEAKSAFLATMSHEIRTPLNGIVGMSTLLNGTNLDLEQRDYSSTIVTAADTLLTIINDILDFSKVEAGAVELEHIPMNLAETVENSVELVAAKVAENDIEFACRINPDVPAGLIGDPVRLKQILMNLLNNAVKFTEKGEVVLTVSCLRPDVGKKPGEETELKLSVRDTGIGIPRDRMDKLFKPFSQIDASTTRRYGGTGLGLVITKRLIELMGGEIEVESEVGTGTTFSFTLPGVIAELPVPINYDKQLSQIKDARILVVDDNRTNCLILNEKLNSWNLQPTIISSPREAVKWVATAERPDCFIVDFKMPEMNGFELARELGNIYGSDRPPIILFTSVSPAEPGFREQSAEIGFSAVLTKPTRSDQLLSALAGALDPDGKQKNEAAGADGPDLPREIQQLKILLVDDNSINRKVGTKILAKLGYEPAVVSSGAEAIDSCKSHEYDVVLMDIEMPDMDGISATREIREILSTDKMPYIVALTAHAMASQKEHYLRSGMDDYLSKPINVAALTESLKAAIRYRHQLATGNTKNAI